MFEDPWLVLSMTRQLILAGHVHCECTHHQQRH
jgi:hypothetical protein